MPGRDAEGTERPDSLRDFPEEFERHPDAPSRDLARREREKPGDGAVATSSDSARARVDAMVKRVRDLAGK